jgi:hypothetical protein
MGKGQAVLIAGALAGLAFGSAAFGAGPPDWVVPYLREDMPEWRDTGSNVVLFESCEVRYLSADRVRRQIRMAERITTETGRARAGTRLSYNADTEKVTSARLWLIAADGKKTKAYSLKDFADTVAQLNNFFWNSLRTLSLGVTDKIEVGGVMAVEYQIESQSGISDTGWSFLRNVPVCHHRFEVIPPAGGRIQWFATSASIPPPLAGSAPGALRWQMDGVRPPPRETPPDGFLPNPLRVSVRCAMADQPEGRLPTWEELARLVADIIEPRLTITPELQAKAEALVAGKPTRWERIRALTEFVQKEVTYLSITLDKDYLAGYRPHPAPEVLQNRYGDCKDKATLLVAMLRAIGEKGYVVLVHAKNPRAIIADWPSASFNHAVTMIPADDAVPAWWPTVEAGEAGRLVVFDPTDPSTPLGALPAVDQGGYSLVITRQRAGLVRLPAEESGHSGIERRIKAVLDGSGALHADVEATYLGSAGAQLHARRAALRNDGFSRLLESRVHETLPLAREVHWTDGWEPAVASYRLNFSFKADGYARRLGASQLLVNPQTIEEVNRLDPWKSTQEGVVWIPTHCLSDEVRLTLPEGFVPEELPENWTREQGCASCRLGYRVEGRDIVYQCELIQRATFLDKADYELLRGFFQKVLEAVRRPVILQRAAVAAAP